MVCQWQVDGWCSLQLRGQPHSSALELVGNGHEGVYLCAVRHMGVVIVQHAFIVEEPIPKTSKSIFQLSFKFCMESVRYTVPGNLKFNSECSQLLQISGNIRKKLHSVNDI